MFPHLKVKVLDLEAGGPFVAVINKVFAEDFNLHSMDRASIKVGRKKIVVLLNIADKSVKYTEIGFYSEVCTNLNVHDGDLVKFDYLPKPASVDFIKKKLDGFELSRDEIDSIVHDIVNNSLSSVELATFVSAIYSNSMTIREIAFLTKAMAHFGETLRFKDGLIVDKHCTGGVPGNRTTMVVVPIIAAAGLKIPKLSSRAISSPAGTADVMEVLCPVSFSVKELRRFINETNACIAWGGALNIASADDELIRVRQPLGLDPDALLLSSIMAKKKAAGSQMVLIDIPFGEDIKVKFLSIANHLAQQFVLLGKELSIHTEVIITDGSQPVGNGIGPVLEAIDVLKVLKREGGPKDLEDKSLMLAGKLLEMAGKAEMGGGVRLAYNILNSKRAYKKFIEIIKVQGGNPNISVKNLKQGNYSFTLKANKAGIVSKINNNRISKICRIAGAPKDKGAGIYLYEHVGVKVTKGGMLLTVYAESNEKLGHAVNYLLEHPDTIIIGGV